MKAFHLVIRTKKTGTVDLPMNAEERADNLMRNLMLGTLRVPPSFLDKEYADNVEWVFINPADVISATIVKEDESEPIQ